MNKSDIFKSAHMAARELKALDPTLAYSLCLSVALKDIYASLRKETWLDQPSEQFPAITNRELAEIEAREAREATLIFTNSTHKAKAQYRRDRPRKRFVSTSAHNGWHLHKFVRSH